MIIEKESKDYFCPIKNDGGEIYCDGSQCAAWRWKDEDYCPIDLGIANRFIKSTRAPTAVKECCMLGNMEWRPAP